MVGVLLVAAALRLVGIGDVPPGLYHDEAYNGLDARQVLKGDLALYFSANNGREPLFIYLVAMTVGLLGRSPVAVRLAAFAPGLLTVVVTYALARALFSRQVGLLSAAVLSVTLWHVHLSRVGFRAVLLPLFIALALWQGTLGWRTGRRRYWIAAGLFYGLSFYTYIPARFTLVALLLFGLYLWRTRPDLLSQRRNLSGGLWAAGTFAVALAPLASFTLLHPDLVLGRTGQVSIWSPAIHGGDFWGTLARHTARTLGMFFVRGDRIWRHNVPWRPVFDPLLGLFFVAGLMIALRRLRRDPAAAMVLIWTATMTLPTLLAEDAPHFLRAVGVLPLATILPALALDRLQATIPSPKNTQYAIRNTHHASRITHHASRITHHVLRITPLLILLIAFLATTTAYFGAYARADATAYWFEAGAEDLAGRVNAFLGTGWDGQRMLYGTPDGREVYIESGLWEEWASVPFLVAAATAVHCLPPDESWPSVADGPAAIFAWPYGDWKRVWSMLTAPAEIKVQEGARSQGDRDPEPFTTYLAFYVTPIEVLPPALATFQQGVELVDARLGTWDEDLTVVLRWHATASLTDNYTVFVHYLRDGQRIGQDDGPPAGGHYPTRRWQVGDLIHDLHHIALPAAPDPARDQILVGLYRPVDGQRLELLDAAGNPAGAFATLPVGSMPVVETFEVIREP
jgi:4-amino-4-deoxy-L-arabinose transferase-like glycosyltransferase